MSTLVTKDFGAVHNPHGTTTRPHMEYDHAKTPEERTRVAEKMRREDDLYTRGAHRDDGSDSSLERYTEAFLVRFGGTVETHPEGPVALGHGLIYTPDMRVTLAPGVSYYVEPHAVENLNACYEPLRNSRSYGSRRLLHGDTVARVSAFCEARQCLCLLMKPNFYFQLVTYTSGGVRLVPENACALCACPACETLFPSVYPYKQPCPVCRGDKWKILLFGDQASPNAVTVRGSYPRGVSPKSLDLVYDATECAVTVPVRGEAWDDIEYRDTYGTPADVF